MLAETDHIRNKDIRIRVTPDEKVNILSRVPAGSNVSDWLRNFALGEKRVRSKKRIEASMKECPFDPQSAKLINHFGWLGNNLNQIARRLNEATRWGNVTNSDVLSCYQELFKIRAELERLKNDQ